MKLFRNMLFAGSVCGVACAAIGTPAQAAHYKVIYKFAGGSDGASPAATMIKVGGTLFGTTFGGGSSSSSCPAQGCGTVFSINLATGAEQVVHAFQGSSDGNGPFAGLIEVGGTLYGTTIAGGDTSACTNGCGTVFAVNPHTGVEKVVYAFHGGGDGSGPQTGLVDVGGTLYGTTDGGGAAADGTVFSFNPASGAEAILHSFEGGSDGVSPYGGLAVFDGVLYGTTLGAGSTTCLSGHGCGTLFSLNLATGTETVLHAFEGGNDAYYVQGSLSEIGGVLYGTSFYGGSAKCGGYGCGTVFSLSLKTGAEKVVHAFNGYPNDGSGPQDGLIDVGGTVYGTTSGGGSSRNCAGGGCGAVFSLALKTGVEKLVYSVQGGTSGFGPVAGLTSVGSALYGTTNGGGLTSNQCPYGCGTVFALVP